MKKILVIDHAENPGIPGRIPLENQGYGFLHIRDEHALEEAVCDQSVCGIFLSFEFNKQEIVSLIRTLKVTASLSPLIVFLGEADELNAVLALEAGADEVISPDMTPRISQPRILKTFEIYEKMRIIYSGKDPSLEEVIHIGEFTIHPKDSKCLVKELEIHLTPRETHFLCYLYKNRGRIISREEIWNSLQRTFGHISPNKRLTDIAIYKLRKKLDLSSASAFNILTVFDKGYYLKIHKDFLSSQTDP